MQIGVITDAHANLPALRSVLRVLDDAGCDLIVHTGDAVGYGPHPREVVETLLGLERAHLLQGNHDQYAVKGATHRHMPGMDDAERAHHAWVRDQLGDELIVAMAEWPLTVRVETGSTGLHFCHYALLADGSDFAPILVDAPPSAFDERFGVVPPALVFFGHHHPAAWVQGANRYINPGALGVWDFPVAHFAIVRVSDAGRVDVQLGHIGFDGDTVIRDLERRAVPARDYIIESAYGLGR